jgi:hypothetical protein
VFGDGDVAPTDFSEDSVTESAELQYKIDQRTGDEPVKIAFGRPGSLGRPSLSSSPTESVEASGTGDQHLRRAFAMFAVSVLAPQRRNVARRAEFISRLSSDYLLSSGAVTRIVCYFVLDPLEPHGSRCDQQGKVRFHFHGLQ